MFENIEIPIDQLPTVSDVEWLPLDPSYRRRLLVDRLIFIAFLLVAATAFQFLPNVTLVPTLLLFAGIGIAAVVMLIWPWIALPRMGYVVRDRDMIYRKGVFFRSVTAVPFNRIQHVETSSSPLDRRFNLATLKLFTAGGAASDLRIDGLGAERAEQLRALVLEKTGASIETS